MSTIIDNTENSCVVCFKTVDIFSIGECDHPVCHECSTRMRVLCLQTECPICRQDLSEVIFTPVCELFKKLKARPLKGSLLERKYKICFTDENVRGSYNKLLDHNCKQCDESAPPFRNFALLKDHMRKDHQYHFCDLCVENLKIFTCERKVYTRPQLALHKRKGDPDDTSHKGHPLCEFCEERYMDTDELYRHLRKDHLYCHLCDSDGLHHYYGTYKDLNDHSRKDHFLCEEGECGEQNLSVFRSDIDLKAHRASVHGQGLSKQASRQARTLEVQFMLTPRPTRGPPPHARAERVESVPNYVNTVEEQVYYGEVPSTKRGIDTDSTEQFPNLGDSSGGPIVSMNHPTGMVIRQTKGALARTEENFPSLSSNDGQAGGSGASSSSAPTFRVNITHQPGPSSAIIRSSAKPNVSIQVHNHSSGPNRISVTETSNKQLAMRLADNVKKNNEIRKFQDEFPSLSKRDMALLANDYVSTNSIQHVKKTVPMQAPPPRPTPSMPAPQIRPPLRTSEAFPELPCAVPIAVSKAAERPQWITVNKTKEKSKPGKVAPAPQISIRNDLDSPAEFPRLAAAQNPNSKQKKKPEKNDTRGTSEDFSSRETNNNNSKKDKKKNNQNCESGERPPDCAPPDLTSKHKRSDKENSQRGMQNNNKKNNERPPDDVKEKKKNTPKIDDKLSNRSGESDQKSKSLGKIMIVNTSESNYPSLNPTGGPPGFGKVRKTSAPPPGFTAKARPPPGFRGTVPPCDAFTFTNSSGESFHIPAHDYVQPPDFHRRNKSLVADFMKALDCRDGIHEFKQLSQMFREGNYSAESYFDHCKKSMGGRFNVIFPELLSLLPDIGKQQELFKLYGDESGLAVCDTCGQVLTFGDVSSHSVSHNLHANFPALGSPTPQTAASWRK